MQEVLSHASGSVYARGSVMQVVLSCKWFCHLMQVVLSHARGSVYARGSMSNLLQEYLSHARGSVYLLQGTYPSHASGPVSGVVLMQGYLPTDWDQKEEELGTQELILCKGICHQS